MDMTSSLGDQLMLLEEKILSTLSIKPPQQVVQIKNHSHLDLTYSLINRLTLQYND